MKKFTYVVLFLILIILSTIFLFSNKVFTPEQQPVNTQTKTSKNNTDSNESPSVTITYDTDGFLPKIVTITSGQTIKLINNSSDDLQFSSDPHPSHTKNSELNIKTLSAGSVAFIKLTKKGTFGYHDHFNSNMIGKIIVE